MKWPHQRTKQRKHLKKVNLDNNAFNIFLIDILSKKNKDNRSFSGFSHEEIANNSNSSDNINEKRPSLLDSNKSENANMINNLNFDLMKCYTKYFPAGNINNVIVKLGKYKGGRFKRMRKTFLNIPSRQNIREKVKANNTSLDFLDKRELKESGNSWKKIFEKKKNQQKNEKETGKLTRMMKKIFKWI